MKVRSYIDTKKHRKLNKSVSVSNSQEQAPKYQTQNCEEQACSTLMQESQLNNHHKFYDKIQQEPDAFLRITPRPEEVQIQSYHQKNKIKNKTKQELSKNYSHTNSVLQQKQQKQRTMRQNILRNFIKTSQQFRNPLVQPFIAGKQVLALTQYIIAEPHHHILSTLQHTKNQYRNKYLRVLKQMKNRYNKKINKSKTQNVSNLNKNQYQFQRSLTTDNVMQNNYTQNNMYINNNINIIKNDNMQYQATNTNPYKQNYSIDNINIKPKHKQFTKSKSNMIQIQYNNNNNKIAKNIKNPQKQKQLKQFGIQRLNIKSEQFARNTNGRKNYKKGRNYSMNVSPQKLGNNVSLGTIGKMMINENKFEKQKVVQKSVFYSHRFSVISQRY